MCFKSLPVAKLAGNSKERRFSKEGGLLNRMFGSSSPTKDVEHSQTSPGSPKGSPLNQDSSENSTVSERKGSSMSAAMNQKSEDGTSGDKKRRSSSVAKAFASAKQSLHLSHSSTSSTSSDGPATPQQTAIHKLGKTDPALSVPQGSLNNSAGESHPGPRSTVRVGVTEDKNKKCNN